MKREYTRSASRAGFTLVELLIVVAIIGVLATMGVPAYKRMVERAKTKEAQVALGGIYTANIAFQSEYGAFGSNLAGIGFDFEGSGANYLVGFADAACQGAGVMPQDAPANPALAGFQIRQSYAQYYDGRTCQVAGRGVTFAPAANACVPPGGAICLQSVVEPTQGAFFVATATGCIRTGCQRGSSTIAGGNPAADQNGFTNQPAAAVGNGMRQDAWAIDHRRQLRRWSDGGS